MLEKAQEVTRNGKYTYLEYVRYADDMVILVDGFRRHAWLLPAVQRRLREELAKLQVEINVDKTRIVDLAKGRVSGSWALSFAGCGVSKECGGRITRPNSGNGRNCSGSSRTFSDASSPNPWIGWCILLIPFYGVG